MSSCLSQQKPHLHELTCSRAELLPLGATGSAAAQATSSRRESSLGLNGFVSETQLCFSTSLAELILTRRAILWGPAQGVTPGLSLFSVCIS